MIEIGISACASFILFNVKFNEKLITGRLLVLDCTKLEKRDRVQIYILRKVIYLPPSVVASKRYCKWVYPSVRRSIGPLVKINYQKKETVLSYQSEYFPNCES